MVGSVVGTLVCILCCAVTADIIYEINPSLDKLLQAKSFSAAPTVGVQSQGVPKTKGWITNRHGQKVPVLPKGGSPILHLRYMAIRGLADLPALLLEVGGLPYRATYHGKEDFRNHVKSTLEFGRLPVLEVEGHSLSQSATIVRYLAQITDLQGANTQERVRSDELYETFKDLFVSHGIWGRFDVEALRNGDITKEPLVHFRDTSNRGEFSAFTKASTGLKTFEDLLATSRTGLLVGANVTYVDLALWQKLHELGQTDALGAGWADKLGLPQLADFVTRVGNMPRVAAFVHSGRRMPRIRRENNDYVYAQETFVTEPSVPKITKTDL